MPRGALRGPARARGRVVYGTRTHSSHTRVRAALDRYSNDCRTQLTRVRPDAFLSEADARVLVYATREAANLPAARVSAEEGTVLVHSLFPLLSSMRLLGPHIDTARRSLKRSLSNRGARWRRRTRRYCPTEQGSHSHCLYSNVVQHCTINSVCPCA